MSTRNNISATWRFYYLSGDGVKRLRALRQELKVGICRAATMRRGREKFL